MGFYHNTTYTFWDARYPGRDWVEYMNNSIKELVDLYQPSVLWAMSPTADSGQPREALPADYWAASKCSRTSTTTPESAEVVANDRWG